VNVTTDVIALTGVAVAAPPTAPDMYENARHVVRM